MTTVAPAQRAQTSDRTVEGAYRMWLRTAAGPEWVDRATDQLGAWLRAKDRRLDIDLSHDGSYTVGARALTVRRHSRGGQEAFRFTMVEGPVGRRFTTTVIFAGGRVGGWMSLQGTNESGRWVDTPKLAINLLESPGSFEDGGRSVSPELWHVRTAEDRIALLDLLVSDRRGAVFVAAAGHQDPGLAADFARKVEEWTTGARGLAHVAFLDHESAAWLAEQVGGGLRVAEWTVRTFRPGIDLGSPATLRLHRTMGMRALIDTSEHRLRRLFSVFARQLLDEQPEPPEVVAWRRTFERLDSRAAADGLRRVVERADASRRRVEESRNLYAAQKAAQTAEAADEAKPGEALTAANTPPSTEAMAPELERLRAAHIAAIAQRDSLLDTLSRVQATLMLPDLAEATLTALLEAATAAGQDQDAVAAGAARIEALEGHVADLESRVAEHRDAEWAARQDAVDAQEQVTGLDETLRQLSRQVAVMSQDGELSDDMDAPLDCPGAEIPGSWQELVDGFEGWRALGLVITADPDTAADLHDVDLDGRCLANAWRGLTALAGYVRAKRERAIDGGFKQYLVAQPAGYPRYNPGWFATSESSNAMSGARAKERDLPVPVDIHAAGVLEMQQHLRIGRIPNLDPRMYIHDDTTGTGVVVVGYIGPHLTTRATAKLNR